MRFQGGIKPFRSQKVRFGNTPGVKILWDDLTGTLGTIFAGDAFNYAFKATSSDNNVVSFSVQSGTLPTGMSLNSATGILSGLSTSAGMFAFVVRASAGKSYVDRTFSITTRAISVAWNTPTNLGSVPAGQSSITNLSATSNDGGTVTYAVTSGALPTGMALTAAGALVGKPDNVGGTATFTIRATRKTGVFADRVFNLNILPDVVTWGTAAGALATIIGGNSFDQTVVATTNQTGATLSYSIIYGTLPDGLTLNRSTGRISGVATNFDGSSVFRIRASDGYGYADREFAITVNADVITWNTASGLLATLNGGQSILGTLSATSNISGRLVSTYTIVSGALPAGLSLNGSTGSISGTATNLDAQAQFIVRATDGIGFSDRAFQINVTADAIVWETQPQVTFNSGDAPVAKQLQATSLSATPITYEKTAGTVPEGFTFDTTSATITGASNRSVSTTLSVRARNSLTYADRTFTVAVNGAPIWTTTEGSLGSVRPGQVFSIPMIATDPDGIGSYTFVGNAPGENVRLTQIANTGTLGGYVTSGPELFPPSWLSSRVLPTVNEGMTASTLVSALPGTDGRTITRYETVGGVLPWGFTMDSTGTITGTGFNPSDGAYTPLQPAPVFATDAALGRKNEGDTLSVTIQASPQLGNTITSYGYVSGQMPWGVTLNGQTGVLSGVIDDIEPTTDAVQPGPAPRWMTANTDVLAVLNETDVISNVQFEALSNSATGIKGYTIQSGTLPWGLTMDATTGVVSGSLIYDPLDAPFLTAAGPLFVTPTNLGTANEGDVLNSSILATPVTGNAVTYALASGNLPWGLTVSKTGGLTGTIQNIEPVTDAVVIPFAPAWQTNATTLFVGDELSSVNTAVVANSITNTGIAAYTIANGTIPWGVTLDTTTGVFSGNIALIEQDDTFTPLHPPVWTTPTNLGVTSEGVALNQALAAKAENGNAITNFSFVSGQMPWGLTVNSTAISGRIDQIDPTTDPIVYLSTPTWQTMANTVLFSGNELDTVGTSVSATGNGITYLIADGTLPWGVSLDSQAGTISGSVILVERDDTFVVNRPPVFVTPAGSLGTINEGGLLSSSIVASPGISNAAVSTYGLVQGTIPWGVTLATNGTLSGTIANIEPVTDSVVDGTPPVWSTASGSLGSFSNTSTISIFVSASLSGNIVSYAVIDGSVPWGTTLNVDTGEISGTVNPADDANKTFLFKIRASTSTAGYADRSFSIRVN